VNFLAIIILLTSVCLFSDSHYLSNEKPLTYQAHAMFRTCLSLFLWHFIGDCFQIKTSEWWSGAVVSLRTRSSTCAHSWRPQEVWLPSARPATRMVATERLASPPPQCCWRHWPPLLPTLPTSRPSYLPTFEIIKMGAYKKFHFWEKWIVIFVTA
jgi:hypothetical protein